MWKALSVNLIVDPEGNSYALTHGVGEVLVAVLNLKRRQTQNTIEELKIELAKFDPHNRLLK